MGLFHPFIADKSVALYGVEAGGHGLESGEHAAPLSDTTTPVGVLHGNRTYVMSDADGQVASTHSISAGLDYPGVGPEHAHYGASGRVRYDIAVDDQALAAFEALCRREGIIPALESCHAVAWVLNHAAEIPKGSFYNYFSSKEDFGVAVINFYTEKHLLEWTTRS